MYTYLVSYMGRQGNFGHIGMEFQLPITVQDNSVIEKLVRETAPGAVVLGFSLYAPDRQPGKAVDTFAMRSDLMTMIRDTSDALADLRQQLAEAQAEIATLKSRTGGE